MLYYAYLRFYLHVVEHQNYEIMKKILFLSAFIFLISSCGTTKKGNGKKNDTKKSIVLPPDVNSNKYSKKRN